MKKNYFIALIALLTFAMNIKAQEINNWEPVNAPQDTEETTDGYNMVVTLPNGTTFTVNTNDVDEVKFSNGKVTISGASIQWLMEKCYELLDRHYQLRDEVAYQLAEQDKKIAILEEVAKVNSQDSYDLWKRDEENTRDIKMMMDNIKMMMDNIKEMMDIITIMQADNVEMMERIYMLEDKNSALESIIDKQNARIDYLQGRIDELNNQDVEKDTRINMLEMSMSTAMSQIAELKKRLEALEQK